MFVQQILGFGLALMGMVLYGIYMVPRKQSTISQGAYTFWMGCGILAGTTLIGLLAERGIPKVTLGQYILVVVSGIVWATGTLAYCAGVKYIGLARSSPIKNTSAILGTLIGILVFHEFSFHQIIPASIALLGSVAVVVSATMLARVESFEDTEQAEGSPHLLYGILASMWASIAYSAYTIPMKMVYKLGMTPSGFLFYMGQGCFIGMLALSLILSRPSELLNTNRRDIGGAALSGAMWGLGSFCVNVAIKLIGVAVAWPLAKNTVVSVLYGVLILKEIDTIKHRRDLHVGLALSIAGVLLLAIAMR